MPDMSEGVQNVVERRDYLCKFVGGTAAVTKVAGTCQGVTVTYIGAGLVDLTWNDNPGFYLGVVGQCFEATTPAGVKSYVLVPGAFNYTTRTLRLSMYEGGALTDLAALEWLTLVVAFAATAVS